MILPRPCIASASWCCRRWLKDHFSWGSIGKSSYVGRHILCNQKIPQTYPRWIFNWQAVRWNSGASDGPVVQQLIQRGLLRVAGADATMFLQGLLTNDVEGLVERGDAMYSMMLNVQGRVVYDLLVYKLSDNDEKGFPVFLVEVEDNQVEDLHKTMARYRIRKKVDVAVVSDSYSVWVAMPQKLPTSSDDLTPMIPESQSGHLMCVPDPRIPALGSRVVLPRDLPGTKVFAGSKEAPVPDFYTMRRYQLGLGEGTQDIPPGNSLPLECNAVFLNGVSFDKGCYIGQELTARTHHTGVIRKRLMPVTFTSETHTAKAGHNVENATSKNCGKVRNSIGQVGLALLRVAEVLGSSQPLCVFDEEKKKTGELETTVPFWWPSDTDPIIKQALDLRISRQPTS